MYWANFLHIYQPPGQTRNILDRVASESYQKLVEGLLQNPQIKITLNINAGLTETLSEFGWKKIIDGLKTLLERGQIEITGTAKYHPVLPLLPPSEIERQIEINEITNRQFFGPSYQPQGFFPPEMAYSSKVGKIIKKMGYKWVILDETAFPGVVDYSKTYKNSDGLAIFFRERKTSFKILSARLGTVSLLVKEIAPRLDKNEYLLTAMDGETFGHHRPGLEQLLWDIGKKAEIATVTITKLKERWTENTTVEPQLSSWAFTNPKAGKFPLARWNDPDNEIQEKQWLLVRLAINAIEKDHRPKSRNLLDRALFSDQFWWASAKPWWSLEMIEKGALALLKAIQACTHLEESTKNEGGKLYLDIILTGFSWQRSGRVEKSARKEDEEARETMNDKTNILSPEDYQEMIKNLTTQMLKAGSEQEYVRAEQIKARIQELKEKKTQIKVNQ